LQLNGLAENLILAHLLVKVYLARPKDNEGTFPSPRQAATCYYLYNHSKVEVLCARTQQAVLLVCSPHAPF